MSLRHSPKALYHPIPQALVDEQQETRRLSAEFAIESAEGEILDENVPILDPSVARVNPRIRWVFLALGAGILLPWNGSFHNVSLLQAGTQTPGCYLVLITATPFFLSRLIGSSYSSTFSSYLSTTFTASNFCFLAHATITSKRVSCSCLHWYAPILTP
jgi:solute carrier family 29 (equilibrative nucleoside transporter), member 1/2/3